MDIWGLLASLAAGVLGVIWLLVKGRETGRKEAERDYLGKDNETHAKAQKARTDVSAKHDAAIREQLRDKWTR